MNSRYRKSRDLIDYDYLDQLSPADLDYLEAFTASFYNGAPSEAPGSIGEAEAAELNAGRRRDAFTALVRVEGALGQVVELPAYRSPFADARKRYRRAVARRRRSA